MTTQLTRLGGVSGGIKMLCSESKNRKTQVIESQLISNFQNGKLHPCSTIFTQQIQKIMVILKSGQKILHVVQRPQKLQKLSTV